MKQFNVSGMSCAACQSRVEKAVSKVPEVSSCSVSLLTNSMVVEGSASSSDIIKAIEDAGYGASERGSRTKDDSESFSKSIHEAENALRDTETPILKKRLLASIGFLGLLMYFSMGHMMWNFPVPKFFNANHIALSLLQMILAAIVMIINKKFFINGFKSLIHLAPNMDTLVAMGSSVSFAWSTLILFKMTEDQISGNELALISDMNNLYFEAAAMIVTLITVGKMLEAMSKGKTTTALKTLMKLAPKQATVIKNDFEEIVPIDEVMIGDIFAVKPGENIPVDGVIIEGSTAIDESALTGESIPVDKVVGDKVSAATLNQSGYIKARATRVGEDTTLSQIIQMVSDASATKAPIAKIADKISGIFVPAVLIIAAVVTIIWLLSGAELGYSLARGISVLVISCPCALGLATPVAIMVGNGKGAQNGILFKTAEALEETSRVQIVALDKTGTITEGKPIVTDVIPFGKVTEKELLKLAFALEMKSEHPLAKAIVDKGRELNFDAIEISDFQVISGNGLKGKNGKNTLYGGNLKFISKFADIDEKNEVVNTLLNDGKTCIYFAKNNTPLGIIAVADTIKEDSKRAVFQLKAMGIKVVMLTGDNKKTARAIAEQVGVDNIISEVLPDGKDLEIQKLKRFGKVAMVGDGINDAPALTRADMGIAIGAGSDVALDAADVVLMNSKLTDVVSALRLSHATVKNIHENLFWAFIYNVILIPVAAGAYVHLTGWTMNPMLGAAAMSLSSFCVVMNALRLNIFNLHDNRKDKPIKKPINIQLENSIENQKNTNHKFNKEKENSKMEKTMKIEGMMCGHCEMTVKKTLESIDGVSEVRVSHEDDNAVIELTKEVSDTTLKEAVEAKDYKVLEIK